jgi:hypothetical protein
MGMQHWQVTVDMVGVELTPDELDRLLDDLAPHRAAVAASPGRVSATMSAPGYETSDAAANAVGYMRSALRRGDVVAVEVLTEAEADARLAQPAFPELVGIAEIANLLGVSRQRASELQTRDGFPAPVAVLRSGPVWRKGDLTSFAATWERKPGRPPSQWQVIGVDDIQWAGKYPTKAAATLKARNILRTGGGGELTVRDKDGRIFSTDTIAGENPTAPRRYLFVQPA